MRSDPPPHNVQGACLDERTQYRLRFPLAPNLAEPERRRDLRFLPAPRDHRLRRAGHDCAHQGNGGKTQQMADRGNLQGWRRDLPVDAGGDGDADGGLCRVAGERDAGRGCVVCRVRIAGVPPDADAGRILFRFQGIAPGGFPVPGPSGDGRRHRGERDVHLRAGHREKTVEPGPGGRRRRTVPDRREPVRGHRRRGDRRGRPVPDLTPPPPFPASPWGMPGMCPGRSSSS